MAMCVVIVKKIAFPYLNKSNFYYAWVHKMNAKFNALWKNIFYSAKNEYIKYTLKENKNSESPKNNGDKLVPITKQWSATIVLKLVV